jgi:hypothetical protein
LPSTGVLPIGAIGLAQPIGAVFDCTCTVPEVAVAWAESSPAAVPV